MPPQLIGVINLTADKPGKTLKHATTIDEARRIADDYRDAGFSAVDLGAQSSHYAAPIMGTSQELGLLVPIIEALAAEGHTVCVETALSDVVAGCFEAGATMFNLGDGLHDPDVVATIARLNPAVIAAYRPTEAREPVDIRAHFQDPVVEGLAQTVDLLREAGVARIIADCGIGYTYDIPYEIFSRYQVETIRRSREIAQRVDAPLLVAVPRLTDWETAAFATLALEHGADYLRCHDVEIGDILRRLF